MADQLLQGAEGDAGRDVESPVVQRADLIMFDRVAGVGVVVPDGQRVAACGTKMGKDSEKLLERFADQRGTLGAPI